MIDADALQRALDERVASWTQRLKDRVEDNLSGGVLNRRSGRLAASIMSETNDDGSLIEGSVASHDVAYAAIQEFGGKTSAHEIVAVKAKALAFAGTGGESFAKSVQHPGSVIPAHAYLGSALAAMQDEITLDLKQCVLDALTQD